MKKNNILNFFTKTLNGMAYGLFATLIIGTIFQTIGTLFALSDNNLCQKIAETLGTNSTGLSFILQILTGAGIGIGIALTQGYSPLKTICLGVVGEVSSYFSLSTKFVTNGIYSNNLKIGDPLTIYFVCIIVVLFINFVLKKNTPVDILIVPLLTITIGLIVALLVRYPSIYITYGIQWLINAGTNLSPFLMGIVVAVLMGMALTAPISSAAIAAIIFTITEGISIQDALMMKEYSGLIIASGAAIVGCSTQMVGFAIQSRKDNNLGIVLSIGIGTSMLQFKNILKKPIIWLPTIITSAILGPIATCLFKTVCIGSSAGMGTAGLVGQIGTISSMGITNYSTWLSIIILEILAPMILVFLVDLLFRKLSLIKDGDLIV